ncbi:MAG: hypothetical protein U9P14_09395, partial [Gemmatimonadota bacterium]|nr:hypothetical protein [Gemmatimonadota bacterium]
MEFTVITAILIMVGYYFLFRVRSSKPKKQEPVRYIRRQVRRSAGHPVEKSSGKPPGPAPAPESKTTEAAGPPSVLDKVKGWRPMSRSDIEVETL